MVVKYSLRLPTGGKIGIACNFKFNGREKERQLGGEDSASEG